MNVRQAFIVVLAILAVLVGLVIAASPPAHG